MTPGLGPASDPRRAFTLETVSGNLRVGLLALVSPVPDASAFHQAP